MVLLITFFVQGAVVVMWGISGVNSALYRGGIIWTLVIKGQKVKCNISTSALRTLKKKGLIESPKARAEKKA